MHQAAGRLRNVLFRPAKQQAFIAAHVAKSGNSWLQRLIFYIHSIAPPHAKRAKMRAGIALPQPPRRGFLKPFLLFQFGKCLIFEPCFNMFQCFKNVAKCF